MIEARSCERFSLLANHVRDRDAELADFYAGLFESEARHHTTYVRLAEQFASRDSVRTRLDQLSVKESEIIARREPSSADAQLRRMFHAEASCMRLRLVVVSQFLQVGGHGCRSVGT